MVTGYRAVTRFLSDLITVTKKPKSPTGSIAKVWGNTRCVDHTSNDDASKMLLRACAFGYFGYFGDEAKKTCDFGGLYRQYYYVVLVTHWLPVVTGAASQNYSHTTQVVLHG
jgi:hypothetical protein